MGTWGVNVTKGWYCQNIPNNYPPSSKPLYRQEMKRFPPRRERRWSFHAFYRLDRKFRFSQTRIRAVWQNFKRKSLLAERCGFEVATSKMARARTDMLAGISFRFSLDPVRRPIRVSGFRVSCGHPVQHSAPIYYPTQSKAFESRIVQFYMFDKAMSMLTDTQLPRVIAWYGVESMNGQVILSSISSNL